jgi:dihydropteroate synthase
MMQDTNYSDLVRDILLYFVEKKELLHQLGVHDVWADPGVGFSKNTPQNYIKKRQVAVPRR